MNSIIQSIAKKKWFIPVIIALMVTIGLSSITEKSVTIDTLETITTEQQIEALCNSLDGVENSKVMLSYNKSYSSAFTQDSAYVTGIVVLCNGGSNPDIKLRIHKILSALYDIPSTKIAVEERKLQGM